MKRTTIVFGLMMLLAPGIFGQQVVLDHVDGQISSGVLLTGSPVTFHFRINNTTTGNIVGLTHGIEISSTNGATWSIPTANWNAGIQTNYFDLGVWSNLYSADGYDADTIGFAGLSNLKPGLPAGFNATVFTITTTFPSSDIGKSIVIDSSFWPPSNQWEWIIGPGINVIIPGWGGPYTFTFANIGCGDVNNSGMINIADVTYLINSLYKGGAAPICCADVNNSGMVNIADVTYLINSLYKGGAAPFCGTVTDIDGNVYQTVKIGNQWWMAENLKTTHYRNGDAIPNVTGNTAWAGLTTGAYCENVPAYGRLYNWYAVVHSRNIAPAGWHVSSVPEWQTLVDYLGGHAVAGGKLKEAGTAHWIAPNTGATNETGFTGLPGGYRDNSGIYSNWGNDARFWSSAEFMSLTAWYRNLNYLSSDINSGTTFKSSGFSLRCVKD